MDIDPFVMGLVDGRKGCAPVNRCQPTGIAMGQDIDAFIFAGFVFFSLHGADDGKTMCADGMTTSDIFIH